MSTKRDTSNLVNLDESLVEKTKEDTADGYTTIENAFTKMKEIQKKMTMQRILEMETSLNKLEKELDKIIKTHKGD